MDPASLQFAKELGAGAARIGGDRLDQGAGCVGHSVEASQELLALVHLAGGDLDVQHDPEDVVNHRVLLVGGLEPPVAPVGRHRGVGVGDADLLEPAGLLRVSALPLVLPTRSQIGHVRAVRLGHRADVPDGQAFPAHVGPDRRGVDVDHLAGGDPGGDAGLDRALEDAPEPLGPPALADASE